MKIVYYGSPDFSAALLHRLLAEPDLSVVAVVSNPDRPKGRSGRPVPTAVATVALERELPLHRFGTLRTQEANEALTSIQADLAMVFAYGSIIPAAILQAPRLGSFNLHGSLLPALRGASPVQTAVLQGMSHTGWTLQRLGEKMDAGDILATTRIEILPDETAGELMERMMPAGLDLVIDSLKQIESLLPGARHQDESLVTFCTKLLPGDAWINWARPADVLHNQIRGMNPAPVARTVLAGKSDPLLLFRSRFVEEADPVFQQMADPAVLPLSGPGTIRVIKTGGKKRLLVQTGSKFLEIIELQPSGRKRMSAADLLNGGTITDGMRFLPTPQSNITL